MSTEEFNKLYYQRCLCGQIVRRTTGVCRSCRLKHKITDVEMFQARGAQAWLSKAWRTDYTIEEQADECIGQTSWGRSLHQRKGV